MRAYFATAAVLVRPGMAETNGAMRDPANAGLEVLEVGSLLVRISLTATQVGER